MSGETPVQVRAIKPGEERGGNLSVLLLLFYCYMAAGRCRAKLLANAAQQYSGLAVAAVNISHIDIFATLSALLSKCARVS